MSELISLVVVLGVLGLFWGSLLIGGLLAVLVVLRCVCRDG